MTTSAGDEGGAEGGVDVLVDIAPIETTPSPSATPTPSATPSPSVSASSAPGAPLPDGLGATGVDPTAAILLGAALLLTGAAALVARLRRRPIPPR